MKNIKYYIPYWIRNIPYWIRTHTINRYHLIDCRDKKNGYEWGWCDRDRLILYSSFKILKDFYEKENLDFIDWNSDPDHKFARQEMEELYIWWTKERPQKVISWTKQDEEDDKMLLRLMKIRGYLWT